MLADRRAFEEEKCPVSEDLLGALYRTDKKGFPELLATVEPEVRALLALFCYPRSHLHELGIAIAATCEEGDLLMFGGRVGAMLHAISRETPQVAPNPSHAVGRRRITLATGQLRQMVPLDDEAEEVVPHDLAFAMAVPI